MLSIAILASYIMVCMQNMTVYHPLFCTVCLVCACLEHKGMEL